jgi:hypothetical protein
MSVLKRAIRGIRDSIPSGYMLGRVSAGNGPAELIHVSTLGQVITAAGTGGGGSSAPAEWNAGSVTVLAGGLSVSGGTLDVTVAQEWSAGTVTALQGLAIGGAFGAETTLTADWNVGLVDEIGVGLTIGTSHKAGTLFTDWGAGSVLAVGTGLTIVSETLSATGGTSEWNAGTVAALGGSLSINGSGTLADALEWNAGTVTALGTGLSITSGTLNVSSTGEWTAGTVSAIGTGLTLTTGTLTASSGGSAFPITAAGTTQSVGEMTVTGTNAGMAVIPNGTGAFMLAVPTGSSAGGNARGAYAVDLQLQRGSAAQVASGANSFVVGYENVASGQYAVAAGNNSNATNTNSVAIGSGNIASGNAALALGSSTTASAASASAIGFGTTASGSYSTVMGYNGTAAGEYSTVVGAIGNDRTNTAAFVHGGGGSDGIQSEDHLLYFTTTGATAVRLTALGSGTATATNTVGVAFGASLFWIDFIAYDRTSGQVMTYTCGPGVIFQAAGGVSTTTFGTAGAPAFTAGPFTSATAVLAAAPTVAADTTLGSFNISVTPPVANTATWHFAARVRLLSIT